MVLVVCPDFTSASDISPCLLLTSMISFRRPCIVPIGRIRSSQNFDHLSLICLVSRHSYSYIVCPCLDLLLPVISRLALSSPSINDSSAFFYSSSHFNEFPPPTLLLSFAPSLRLSLALNPAICWHFFLPIFILNFLIIRLISPTLLIFNLDFLLIHFPLLLLFIKVFPVSEVSSDLCHIFQVFSCIRKPH